MIGSKRTLVFSHNYYLLSFYSEFKAQLRVSTLVHFQSMDLLTNHGKERGRDVSEVTTAFAFDSLIVSCLWQYSLDMINKTPDY